MLPNRKQIHLKDFDYTDTNVVYFLTICTYGKNSYFKKQKFAKIIADDLNYRSRVAHEVKLYAHCLMPDHVHVLLKLNEGYGKSIQNWVAAFKRYTARVLSMMYGVKPLWQSNFYEHIVRKEESLKTITEYIANNPVRKNMVKQWVEYQFSKINYDAFDTLH
ncbi:MAG TPA: transposase [Thermodesulfobacteriota bacterium]|nr:transposase [Thermodesulfobacteriota bacterium]